MNGAPSTSPFEQVQIEAGEVLLPGFFVVPEHARGIIVFAHGVECGRFHTGHRYIADRLQQAGMATLVFDLLTKEEEFIDRFTADFHLDNRRFVERIGYATDWLAQNPRTADLSVGYFGKDAGAGTVLAAARLHADRVRAVVAVGGPIGMTAEALHELATPTLFIVGDHDDVQLRNDRRAIAELGANDKELIMLPGTVSEFERNGQWEEVTRRACDWFAARLTLALC